MSKPNVNKVLLKMRDDGLVEGLAQSTSTDYGLEEAKRFGDYDVEEEEDKDPHYDH